MRTGDANMGVERNTIWWPRSSAQEHPDKFSLAYLASDDIPTKESMAKEDDTIHFTNEIQPFHIDLSVRTGSVSKKNWS